MKIEFTLPYPKPMRQFCKLYGLNAIYSGKHWSKRRQDSEYWHLLVKNELRKNKIPKKEFKKPVIIRFSWNDGLDCSNHAYAGKMIEDALKGWVIHDDSKKYVREIRHRFHDENYIMVEVMEDF